MSRYVYKPEDGHFVMPSYEAENDISGVGEEAMDLYLVNQHKVLRQNQ